MKNSKDIIITGGIYRFIELMLLSVLPSATAAKLCAMSAKPMYFLYFGIGALIFIIANAVFMRQSYMALASVRDYFRANYAAYGAFLLIGILVLIFSGGETHSWLFGVTKVLVFGPLRVGQTAALVVFHMFMVIMTFLTPVFSPDTGTRNYTGRKGKR